MRKAFLVLLVVVSVVMASTTVVLAADNWIGTWKLNVAKSKYSPGPAPKSSMLKVSSSEGGMTAITDGVDAQGKPTHTEIMSKFDGKDYALKGAAAANTTRAYKRIDDNTFEFAVKVDGKATVTVRNGVSRDGKTQTATVTGKNAQGQDVHNTLVLEKQ